MPTEISDYSISGSTIIDSTGNFNVLTINNSGILLDGQLYLTDIVDISGNITGLNYLGESPSGTFLYTTGLNQFTTGVITDFARSILDDADVDAVRTTLGLQSLSTVSGVLVLGSDVAQDIILSNISGSGTIFNNQRKDIDFYVKGTGSTDSFFYDASMGRLGVNTLAPDAAFHIVSDCALDGVKIESNTNCTTGVHLFLHHNPGAVPTEGSYPATISLAGRDDNANVIYYAQLKSKAVYVDGDVANGTQGELLAYVDHDGTGNLVLRLSNSGTYLGPHNSLTGGSTSYNLMGSGNTINGNSFVIIGNTNSADPATNTVIVGSLNDSYGASNRIVGRNIEAQGSGNSLFGFNVYTEGDTNYVYANNVLYSGDYSALIGNVINGSGNYTILIGNNLYNSGNLNSILGSGVNTIGHKSTLLGQDIFNRGHSGIIIGINNAVTGDSNVVIGNNIDVISTGLFICGDSINVNNVIDSLILEKDITISNASGIVIVGRGNDVVSTNNTLGLYGYGNVTSGTIKNSNLLGDSNILSGASGSLILGGANTAMGTINNNILIGKQNYVANTSNNNIFIGNLNNHSGLRLNNDGSITGVSTNNNPSRFINTVAIGNQNVFQSSGNLQIAIGNKNDINGLYNTIVGHINTLRNSSYDIIVGKSNYVAGPSNIVVANDARVFGNNNVVLSPSENARVFGQDVISVGSNNGLQSNGSVVGYDNSLYGDNNNVFGSNNTAGLAKYLYTATILSNQFASSLISFNSNITTDVKQGDGILVYLYNPVPTDGTNVYVFERTVNTIQWDGSTTAITLSSNITLQTQNPQSNPNSFDDAFNAVAPVTQASGYIIKKSAGSNNYIYGDLNSIKGTGNTIVGYKNTIDHYTTGSIILGNNITHSGNNYMVIGPDDTKKVIIGDKVVFNSGLSTTNIYAVGTNNITYFDLDNANRRVGIRNTAPRSELDVSGTITTNALRIGLSATNGQILVTDANGNISYTDRTMVSGVEGGIVSKLSSALSSGNNYFRWNSSDHTLSFYSWNTQGTPQPANDPSDTKAIEFIVNTGLIINSNRSNNNEYINLKVYGNANKDDIDLIVTDVENERLFINNVFMNSGTLSSNLRTSGSLILPNLLAGKYNTGGFSPSGTFLRIALDSNNSGTLIYNQLAPNTIVSTTSNHVATGYMNLRWFESDHKLCIGNKTNHTENAESFDIQNYNTVISNQVDADGQNYTVFNRYGLGSWAGSGFVVLYSGVMDRGLRLDYLNSKMGVNTSALELAAKSNALVVNGSIYCTGLRLGESAESGYVLTAVDDVGNLGLRALSLSLVESNLSYPFVFETVGGVEKLQLSNYDEDDVALTSTKDMGRILAWNNNSWYIPKHFRLYEGSTTLRKNQVMIGQYASTTYISTQNAHAFSAGNFYPEYTTSTMYEGSSQYLQFYMRGSGNGAAQTRLSTEWSYSNPSTTAADAARYNVIILPNGPQNYHAWLYEAKISVLGVDGSSTYAAGAMTIKGAVKRLGNNASIVRLGTEEQSKFMDTALAAAGAEMSLNDPITGAMTLRCTGVANYQTAWSATITVNQLSLPSVGYTP